MMQPINYLMRGVRVEILSEDTIDFFANEAAKFLGVDKRTRKKNGYVYGDAGRVRHCN